MLRQFGFFLICGVFIYFIVTNPREPYNPTIRAEYKELESKRGFRIYWRDSLGQDWFEFNGKYYKK